MNTIIINFKTEPKVKKEAMKIADELGFSLSSILNAYLKNFIRTKKINYSLDESEPSEYLLKLLANKSQLGTKNTADTLDYLDKLTSKCQTNKHVQKHRSQPAISKANFSFAT